MFTKKFQKISKDDADIAGGKGASLGEMTQAEIPIPGGFVVLSSAFESFLEETDLSLEIDSILHKVDHNVMHTVEDASEKIQALIKNADFPEDIKKEVQKEFNELDADFVAVRSSATAEDSASAAWAGQLDSFLNTTEKTLFENIQNCWASLFTPRAIFYRFEQELHKHKISVAVVVQKMVQSEMSGIAFSVHPVTEDYDQLIIEAGFGLGEAIVSGQITPDSYVVEKEPRNILDKNIVEQTRGLFRNPSTGSGEPNEWRDIPKEEGERQVLTDEQILELSELILKIEKHYGFPCDIEWAFEGDEFFITQSRPITTLSSAVQKIGNQVEIEKMFSREHSLFYCCVWSESDSKGLKKWAGQNITNSVFMGEGKKKKLNVYYDPKDFEEFVLRIKQNSEKESSYTKEVFNEFKYQWKYIFPLLSGEKKIGNVDELKDFYFHFISWWSPMAVVMNIPDIKELDDGVRKQALKMREETEKYSDKGDGLFLEFFSKYYPEYEDIKYVISPEEIFSLKEGDLTEEKIKEIKKRLNGYFVTEGKLFLLDELDKVLEKKNLKLLELKMENIEEVSGQIAYKGKARGKVKKILYKKDLKNIGDDKILVTEMTSPEFIPVIKKSKAIVTDEGGITCHAAIVSRELKKPCIIGTKIATQVLKDGDLVEVDAERGIVTILKGVGENGS